VTYLQIVNNFLIVTYLVVVTYLMAVTYFVTYINFYRKRIVNSSRKRHAKKLEPTRGHDLRIDRSLLGEGTTYSEVTAYIEVTTYSEVTTYLKVPTDMEVTTYLEVMIYSEVTAYLKVTTYSEVTTYSRDRPTLRGDARALLLLDHLLAGQDVLLCCLGVL